MLRQPSWFESWLNQWKLVFSEQVKWLVPSDCLKWRCSPPQHRIQTYYLSFPHVDLFHKGAPHGGTASWPRPGCHPPGWPGEPPPSLATTWPLHHHWAWTQDWELQWDPCRTQRWERRQGRSQEKEVPRLLFGLCFSIKKSFKALILIGISHQNMAIIVSIPNKVQKCHIRQNLVPQGQ